MMDKLWVVLLVALTGAHFGQGLPLRSTPHSYPHNTNEPTPVGWTEGSLYAAVPALALIVTAVGLLFGCTWCYRHKDCKQNEGADNQLFTASATHLHERRSHPPDSGFSEPANNNISEDNNNGPISLREMQNIANNNAAAYIVSENEERNRVSRESVVEFEPLPTGIRVADPLEGCVDWFGDEDFPRNRLQYLREIGRGWFGRVVEGEIEDEGTTTTVAVKILNQTASLEDKARFLHEARLYRDASHENVLAFVASCLQEDPWILIFELCSVDLQTYLTANRPKMAALNESGVPLRLVCDVTSALSYLHSRGETYGELCTRNVMVRGTDDAARAVLGHYGLDNQPLDNSPQHTAADDISALGSLLRDVCSWGAAPPLPDCPYREHLHQVMQLCWNANPDERPSSAQVHSLLEHLHLSLLHDSVAGDFEERWQRLKPNTIPKLDEHVAIVHFAGEEFVPARDSLGVADAAVSRSSSIMSDRDMSVQVKSESMTNLHGSLEDVRCAQNRNVYLEQEERPVPECHRADPVEDVEDRSDASVDPWLKDIIAGSQDDVSYYRDVSDVIKNLDNILNSEKTSSSESSHQASPSRDNLSLDCKRDYPMQSSMVKSPGISNFQNILEVGFEDRSPEKKQDEEEDRDTIGTLSHSFERHSDTTSQHTLENLTPDTPIRDMELPCDDRINAELQNKLHTVETCEEVRVDAVLPKENKIDNSNSVVTDLCIAPIHSVNEVENVYVNEDCQTPSDSNLTDIVSDKETVEAKSISEVKDNDPVCESVEEVITKTVQSLEQNVPVNVQNKEILPVFPEIIEDNKIADLLPNAPLVDNHAIVSQPETTSANSQKEINNDLIIPAESTTDSKITPIDMVAQETKPSALEIEQLDNVNQLTFERPPRIEETEQDNSNIPTFEMKEESLPESVQSEHVSATPVISGTFAESNIRYDIEAVPVSITETDCALSRSSEGNLPEFLEKDKAKTNHLSNVTTPTLVLSEVEDDIQISTNIERVPEEFVDKIIKEAETAALNSIESAHTKVSVPVPVPFIIPKTEVMNIFLENEIKASEKSAVKKDANNSEVEHDIKEPTPECVQQDSPSIILNEEAKIPIDINLDNIAKEILLDAIQDVPKAMEQVNATDFFQGDELKVDHITPVTNSESFEEKLLEPEFEVPVTESVPEIGHNDSNQPISEDNRDSRIDNKENVKVAQDLEIHATESLPEHTIMDQIIFEKQNDCEVPSKETETHAVIPQVSLDVESTASADSSQSTLLIKDTVKEESKSTTEISKRASLDEPVQEIMGTEVNVEVILNTFLGSERNVEESVSTVDTEKHELPSPNEGTELSNVTEEIITKENSNEQNALPRSENKENINMLRSNDSTAYMNFADGVQAEIIEQDPMADDVKDTINSCLETPGNESCSLVKNESTEYLDLPTMIRDTDDFLHAERQISSQVNEKDPLCSSTPKSAVDDTSNSIEEKSDALSETKVPDYGPGVTLTKLEQQCVPDFLSPFDSPTKSHPTDTYDENSSVVLGPFENCTMELFKGLKTGADIGDIPKEEMLAFSSNFSEINLETPSPLRDGNFLNEVPDIVHDDIQFDDITSEPKDDVDPKTDSDPTDQSLTEKKVSPSTPPNSPGYFLASTSQQKYLVDIDLNQPTEPAPVESDSGLSSLHKEIELNQIELQITSKLAMAENENNLNIEYSGPLTVEGLVENDLVREEESAPETFLAGNGGNIDDVREMFTLDEDCVNALRNELELKLPLAQVAAIEPACETESETENESWSGSLPPPPELVLSYPGALSPIAEETGPQLSAYENDALWNASIRTDSSESYPEPCNNSTEEPTELPTGLPSHDTYSLPGNHTYTVQATSSKEITMSADSLNASPAKTNAIDDRTFTKDDDKPCERISQVSPFVLSPTTDSSAPASIVTGVSTLSRTTGPTDANASKPEETQLSKATSIDSWCSNDTLYNVEEAFDDLASDPELPADFDGENDPDNSESSHTLTVNDEKELSHVSTYIVHDSDDDDRFSPDSITANDNDNYTYTKPKTDAVTSEVNDSKTQTKDLAYGTMGSGPSYSNCTTEVLSADNGWMFPHPELVRRSPIERDVEICALPTTEHKQEPESSPQLNSEPCVRKMDSVEISCLEDDLLANETSPKHSPEQAAVHVSPDYHCGMATGYTSTPLTEAPSEESVEPVTMSLVEETRTPENLPNVIPNFQSFFLSAELRAQVTPIAVEGTKEKEVSLEGDSTRLGSDVTPSFIEFMQAATSKPQEMSRLQSSQNGSDDFGRFENSVKLKPQDLSNASSAVGLAEKEASSATNDLIGPIQSHVNGSDDFGRFENSVKFKPQDLSANASSALLLAEKEASNVTNDLIGPSQSLEPTTLVLSPPSITNFKESHVGKVNTVIITDLEEDETEQPHSIIIAEVSKDKESPNITFDSHVVELNHTYDSHSSRRQKDGEIKECNSDNSKDLTINGINDESHESEKRAEAKSPEAKTEETKHKEQTVNNVDALNDVPNGSVPNLVHINNVDIKCNGKSEKFATVNFINESFEELIESNVDDGDLKDKLDEEVLEDSEEDKTLPLKDSPVAPVPEITRDNVNGVEEKMAIVTEDFLQNEKKFCQLDAYLPLLSDIRFTGPASEIMSTSFTQDSPTDALDKPDDMKEWDSDSDSHSSNSSSGEFIWKVNAVKCDQQSCVQLSVAPPMVPPEDQRWLSSQHHAESNVDRSDSPRIVSQNLIQGGDGQETSVVPTTQFDHRGSNGSAGAGRAAGAPGSSASGSGSGSGSGSEGDEVEFVPSSWDCRAEPAKSSLRSLRHVSQDNKKRVVFKRQKYHCVYEYPRELAVDVDSPAYLPDLSTYTEWDPTSAEEAELGYGQLFGAASPLDLYPLRGTIAFGADYDEDFFISSSARPFESLGVMSTTSQFFPGMSLKPLVDLRDHRDHGDHRDDFPPPPSPLATTLATRTPSLDFTTPDSGVEDITPGSTEEDFKTKKLPESEVSQWRSIDSGSSSESVSPSSPGGEALGGLRHTRDKLKLDLPPSPHIPSPRHNRVFNFILDKPKRRAAEPELATTLVMTDDTPVVTGSLPVSNQEDSPAPEPTFSTFGKSVPRSDPEQKIILTDDVPEPEKPPSPVKEPVRGEGTVLDSGDEDSGIESSSKATLERKQTPNVS